jgi:hypothetical protein
MTENSEDVHILDDSNNHILSTENLVINYTHCMARKADKSQCTHRKKNGDYCGLHTNKLNIIRIDEELPNIKKRNYQKKINKLEAPNIHNSISLECYQRNIPSIIKIQALFRGSLVRLANKLRGPGYMNRSICNNTEDIYLFESLNEIHPNDFMTIKDKDSFIYGFHIESIYKYIQLNKDKERINNPYNKNIFDNKIVYEIEKLYNLCKILGIHNTINNILPIDAQFVLRNKVVSVFQKMDELNNYTDIEWFMTLTNLELVRLTFLVKDLFDYRMELSSIKKKKIVKIGNVFIRDSHYYKHLPFDKLRLEIIEEFDKLVSEGETRDDKYLGSLIILSGVVELVPNCALAYPWLIQGTFH